MGQNAELVQLLKTIKLAITMKLDKTHKVAEFADPLKVINLAWTEQNAQTSLIGVACYNDQNG